MTQRSLFWDGTATGDCGPYSQTHVCDQFFRSVLNGTGNRGVCKGWLNQLEVSGIISPLTIASGGAVVYGNVYENTVAAAITVPTPLSGLSRIDRIVIQRRWATQVTRIARVAGTAAVSPIAPALTQSSGTIYEIPLAQALIDSAGTITVTDEREWVTFSTKWPAGSISGDDFTEGAVTAAKIPDRIRYIIKDAGQLKDDSTDPATWVAGGSYDYWSFATAVTNAAWLYDFVPYNQAGSHLSIYLWSVPNANGAGVGAENVRWEYEYSVASNNTVATFTPGPVIVDQQARVNTTIYRDLLIAIPASDIGRMIILKIARGGADGTDTYNNSMRLIGVEIAWTADA